MKYLYRMSPVLLITVMLLFLTGVHAEQPSLTVTSLRQSALPLQRNVPVVEDVLIVKRHTVFAKASPSVWQKTLSAIKSVDAQPLFEKQAKRFPRLRDIHMIRIPAGNDVFAAAEKMLDDPSVVWAEPLYIYQTHYQPSDPGRSEQWYMDKIQIYEAWEQVLQNNEIALNDTNVLVAIIDTGVDTGHPDLRKNIWQNPDEIPDNGIDDDNNGYVDDIVGWDFGDSDNDPTPSETAGNNHKWHGTWVAGVASAVTDNRLGIAAPAYNAKIMAIKTTRDTDPDQGVAYWPIGVVYAAQQGADIINCSFSGPTPSNLGRLVMSIAMNQGSLVVAAAANQGNDSLHYPASYRRVFSVSATDEDDKKASFSTYNAMVDISAPGVNMHTTGIDRKYDDVQGTSFAAPLVASVAALVKAVHPEYTFAQIREQVRVSADYIDDLNLPYRNTLGRGRLNAYQAIVMESPSVRIADVYIEDDDAGNGDAIAGENETFNIVLKLKNFLQPASNVRLTLSSRHPDIVIEKPTSVIGAIGTLDSLTNTNDPFTVRTDASLTGRKDAVFTLAIEADNNYEDLDYFIIELNQGYTIKGGNVSLTISNDGNLGYLDFSTNRQGAGFTYSSFGSLLYEGSFLAGTGRNKVSDEARFYNDQDTDFTPAAGSEIIIKEPGDFADVEGQAVFTDLKTSNPINLWVRQTAYAFNEAPDNDYIILQYELSNVSNAKIEGLFAGHYLDWDLRNAAYNKTGYDASLNTGYIYDSGGSGYGGCQVLSSLGMTAYKSIHHEEELYVYDAFSDSLKWGFLSGGVQHPVQTAASDYSHIVGTGPINIAPDDTVIVGFAIIGAHQLSDYKENAKAAQTQWNLMHGAAPVNNNASVSLSQNYPNPFSAAYNNRTTIEVGVSEIARVELTIYNILGQEVIQLLDAELEPGIHQIEWNGNTRSGMAAASGVYFCRLKSGSNEMTQKIVILR